MAVAVEVKVEPLLVELVDQVVVQDIQVVILVVQLQLNQVKVIVV